MKYEDMNIEELEAREKDLKEEYFDIDERKAEIKEEINIIKNIKKEKLGQKEETNENTMEESSVVEEVVETPVEANTLEQVVESTPLVPIVESNENQEQQEETTENVVESQAEVVPPLIPTVENSEAQQEEKTEDVINPQSLEQTPLTPVEIEIPTADNVEIKEENSEVYTKIDNNTPRAILTNISQSDKLRKSKELNKSIVLGSNSEVKEETPVELPKVEENVNVAPLVPEQKTSEQEINDMMEQATKLYNEGKTAEAEELTAKILSKKTA